MADYNEGICAEENLNTGYDGCVTPPAPLVRVISTAKNEQIPASFWLTPEVSLKGKLLNDDATVRWSSSPRFNDVTEAIQETATVTAADGSIFTLKEGSTNYQFLLKDTNPCAQKAIRAFDGTKKPLLLVQSNRVILGQKSYSLTSPYAMQMGGYKPQRAYVPKASLRTNADTANSMLMLNFIDPKQDEANMVSIALPDIDLDSLLDQYVVTNAYIRLSTAMTTTGVVKFKIWSGCGNVNLGIEYAADWTAALFTFINATTGLALAKTIAINATTGEITMTATTPPAASTPMVIGLAAISVLEAAGIEYYETPASRLDGTVNDKSYKLTVLNT